MKNIFFLLLAVLLAAGGNAEGATDPKLRGGNKIQLAQKVQPVPMPRPRPRNIYPKAADRQFVSPTIAEEDAFHKEEERLLESAVKKPRGHILEIGKNIPLPRPRPFEAR